jgi:hypothetical protein
MTGSNGHKPDCGCPLCRGKARTAERERAEAEQEATHQAVARTLVRLLARGALSGPDALRNLVGHDDALRVLRAAGIHPGQAAASWQAEAAPRQATTQLNGGFAGDPDHDPRVTEVMRRPGASWAEINAVRGQLSQEYRAREAEKAARRQSNVMWHTRDGEAVTDGTAPPVQAASRVNQAVPPLGSEEA